MSRFRKHNVKVKPVAHEIFLRGGFRLVHSNCSFIKRYLMRNFLLSGRHLASWLESPKESYALRDNSTICAQLWKPGWGIHSDRANVELKLRPGAEICVFTHDVYSDRRFGSGFARAPEYRFGDRELGADASLTPHMHGVTHPRQLGITRLGLEERKKVRSLRVCKDPVNEIWIKGSDILQLRAIQIGGAWDSSHARVDTHDFNKVSIETVGRWADLICLLRKLLLPFR